jgi:sulfoxide reductase catalytic subunit YedY
MSLLFRCTFGAASALGAGGVVGGAAMSLSFARSARSDSGPSLPPLPNLKKGPFGTDERQNSYEDITHYNNYYEFGTDKTDPAANASAFPTRPWKIAFEGEIKNPQSVEVDAT